MALLNELPNATGIGTDISRAALEAAQINVAQFGFESRSSLIACDMAAGVQGNSIWWFRIPPYIARGEIASLAPEVRDYDPMMALDGGDDGLTATVPFQPMQNGFWHRADDYSWKWVQDRNPP